MNREYSHYIIKKLFEHGVAEFYVCSGARNFPLVETVLNIRTRNKIVFNHFEERSAAFYALGRIKTLKKPVAVITTSGTAVGELLPATMEAYYSGLPLVLITADRPRSYRGTGAPQSAEQKNILGTYVSKCFDLETKQDLKYLKGDFIPKNTPLHINICFDAPIQSGCIRSLVLSDILKKNVINNQSELIKKDRNVLNKKISNDLKKLNTFLKTSKNLVVIVSKLKTNDCESTIQFLKRLNAPVYLESISNIRERKEIAHLRIHCADQIFENTKKSNYTIDCVLKIGGTPTHRFWRDLDEIHKHIKVFSIHDLPFPGMRNIKYITTDLTLFFHIAGSVFFKTVHQDEKKIKIVNQREKKIFLKYDHCSFKEFMTSLKKQSFSEQNFIHFLSKKITPNSKIYLGNSMPIRNWDMVATYKNKNFIIDASRGLNGIDGQISTFIGFASESSDNWGIFGDLTTLYDLAGPWMLAQRPNLNIIIVVINNHGGRIFRKILQGEHANFSQNTHHLSFMHLAKMWSMSYKKVTKISDIKKTYQGQWLLEISCKE